MADYPRPSKVDMKEGNLEGFTAAQPPTIDVTKPYILSGADLLKRHAPGKMNENRRQSLKGK